MQEESLTQDLLFHITERAAWLKAQSEDVYEPVNFAVDGFIHLSNRSQILRTANRFYAGKNGLVLLAIDPELVTSQIVYENLEGGSEPFPHLYGRLNHSAVVQVLDFPPDGEGFFHFPAVLQGD